MKSKIKRLLALVLCLTMVLNGNVSLLASDEAAAEDQVVAEAVEEMMEEVAEEATEETIEEVTEEVVEEVVEETAEEAIEEVAEESENVVEEVVESEIASVEVVDEETTKELLTYTWENDGVTVEVTEKVAGAIPAGVELSVKPIIDGQEYKDVETQLQEKAENEEYEIAGFLAYDICFVDAQGNEIEPTDNVNVSIKFDEAVIPEMDVVSNEELDVTVMHFEENANGEVAEIVDMVAEESIEATVVATDEAEVEKVEFVTDSFSTFTITWTGSSSRRATITVHYVNLDGEEISASDVSNVTMNGTENLNEYQDPIDGYEYRKTVINSFDSDVEISQIRVSNNVLQYYANDWVNWETIGRYTTVEKDIYIVYEDLSPYFVIAEKVNMDYGYYDSQKIRLIENTPYSLTDIDDYTSNGYTYNFEGAFVKENGGSEIAVASVVYKNGSYYYTTTAGTETAFTDNTKLYFKYSGGPDPLTTIETVDHTSSGIIMTMKNYNNTNFNQTQFMSLGGGWANGRITQGLVGDKLGTDGYPVNSSGQSIAEAFNNGKAVNHLFTKEFYDQTGYYEFSSFENYAYLNADGNFTVYEQIGSPSSSLGSTTDRILYQRGHFYPYNNITPGDILSGQSNMYDEDGNELATTHPRYDEDLYRIANPDYYFGMYMEADFVQPKNGIVQWKGTSNPMRYEFNGDDDLWVFIDNVLILDLGGIHVAHRGYIDFSNGDIAWDTSNSGATPVVHSNIKAVYQELGIFPDGTTWDDEKVNQYFRGNTFADYTAHTMKMFYMERGAGGSDIHVKFNLPVIPKGTFDVTKELANTDKEKYANVEFAFQAFAQEVKSVDPNNGDQTFYEDSYVPITSAVYKKDGVVTTTPIQFKNGQEFNGKTYDNVFYLKPGETAHFSDLQEDRKYYVVEVGVNAQEYDKVVINNAGYTQFDDNQIETGHVDDVITTSEMVSKRPLVVYTNRCSAYNSRELRITKSMVGSQVSNDAFTFKVMLEDATGVLVPYVGPYYLQDAEGKYYTYVDGVLSGPQTDSVVCGNTTEEGLIKDVKVGYTASITGILSETEFAVSEVEINEQYIQNPTKVVSNCDTTLMEGADGAISLGKDATVVISNAYKKTEDNSFIKVSKTFVGIDPVDYPDLMNNFKITVSDKEDSTLLATLKLTDEGVNRVESNTGITYTWILDNYSDVEYIVAESNQEIENYQNTILINGVVSEDGNEEVSVSDGMLAYTELISFSSEDYNEVNMSSANLIAAKLAGDSGYFVWTQNRLSVADRLAVVGIMRSSFQDANITLDNCYFYSGDISDTLVFRGDEICYDGSTLKLNTVSQWSQIVMIRFTGAGAKADILLTNTYVENTADLDLFKTTENGTYVSGAEFKLSKLEGDKWIVKNVDAILVENENGKIELVGLTSGIYMLEETKAPVGCRLLEDKIYFKVELGSVSLCDASGKALTTAPTMWELTEDGLTIKNHVVYELPQSGGLGIYTYTIGGILLMAFAALILYKNRRKEVLVR